MVNRHAEFQKIRQGPLEEALDAFQTLSFKADQFDRLRRHAVTEEEERCWNDLRLSKYRDLSNRKAAHAIKSRTGSHRSAETIRIHIVGTGAIPSGNNDEITQ